MVTFTSSGSDLYLAFGNANVKIESAEVSVAVSEVLAANWASGVVIPAGSSLSIPVPYERNRPYVTHFAVDSSAATGSWSAYLSSGAAPQGEALDTSTLGNPLLDLDAASKHIITLNSGAITVANWKCRVTGAEFTEASAPPDLLDPTATGSGVLRPAVSFVAGSSEKMTCTNSTLAALLGSSNAFTIMIAARRTATGAAHCLFSVGTAGSDNGRWDITLDASDDVVMTRVTAAGSSTASTYATTMSAGMYTILFTFDGSTPLLWLNGTSQSLSGTAAGSVGTTTRIGVGCRVKNTSTNENFASAEISEVLVFGEAFTGLKLTTLQAWMRRRFGV